MVFGQPSILELANSIQSQVIAIHEALVAAGQPDPSFDVDAPSTNFDVPGIQSLRTTVLGQIEDLHDLLMTPLEALMGVAATDYVSRHALDRFKVYDHVPVGETKTYTELAAATELPVATVQRLIRHAMTQRIFIEPSPGVVAHTPASKLITENAVVRDYWGTLAQIVMPAAAHATHAMQRWPNESGNGDATKSGYFLASGKTGHQLLADDPEQHRRYDSAMGISRYIGSFSIQHIANGFDWAMLGEATVVDIAGGVGTVSKELAKRFEKLNFIVQDRADVIARASLEEEEESVRKRIKFMEHDMFTPQPIKGAEVYFFRRVFMEWTDEKSSAILRNLVPALKEGYSRVIIADVYVPEPGSISRWEERRFRSSDMLALAVTNGGEKRDQKRWEKVFGDADRGYTVERVTPLPNSETLLTESIWRQTQG